MSLGEKLKYSLIRQHDIENQRYWTRSEKRRWFFTLFAGCCMVYATRTTMPLLMPSVAGEKRYTKTESGTILSSFFWGYCLSQIYGGLLSDKYGGQRIIFISSIFWSIITIAMPSIFDLSSHLSTLSLPFIVLVRILNGAMQGVYFPAMMSITSQNLSETERGNFFSLLTMGSAFGTLTTGLLGTFVLDYFGWAWVFQVIGFIGISWALLLRYYTISSERQRIINISASNLCIKNGISSEVPWLKLISSRRLWACVIGQACEMNCFFVLLSWLPTYFNENFPHRKTYLVNFLPWIFVPPCTIFAKYLSENLLSKNYQLTSTRKIIQGICFVVQSVSLMIVMSTKSFPISLICMCTVIGMTGFHASGVTVNPQDLSSNFSGSVFGLMNTVGATVGFLGVYLAGHILELTQSWNSVFNLLVTGNLIGLFVFSLFGSSEPII
ncbi:CLUMA_CG014115, isoform A [Clunio marinus]|uniref:CLUMA_CG014115, isoform A n=1 Tax=Clunio marinus TaxID=568069 RepID=A0A1J1IL26_9DIPT|nr:CLUMA_CG014115, isoform A [Clunio marinus]